MLKNAPALAIVAVDTAENGPSKVRQVTNKVCRNIGKKRQDRWLLAHQRGHLPRGADTRERAARRGGSTRALKSG